MQRLLPVLFDWSAAAAFSYWRSGHSSHSRHRSARSEKESVFPSDARIPSGRTTHRGGASGASAARSTTAVAFRSRMTRLTRAVWVPPSTVIAPSPAPITSTWAGSSFAASVPVRGSSEFFNIQNRQRRVCDRLAEDALRVRTECLLDLGRRRIGIYERELDAEFLQRNREQVESAAIYLRGRNDVVARVAEVQNRERRRRLAGRREHCCHAPLKRRDLLRHLVVRGIGKARVEISGLLEVKQIPHLLRGLVPECRGGVYRHLPRLALLWLPSSLDTQRVCSHNDSPFEFAREIIPHPVQMQTSLYRTA